MEHCEKPPILKGNVVLKCIAMILLLFFCGRGALMSLYDCIRFSKVQSNAVTVDAVVSNVEVEFDSEDGNEYDVYVRYTYAGESYEVRYLNDSDEGSWMDKIGQSVSLEINPHRPEELIVVLKSSAQAIALELCLLNLALALWVIPTHKNWTRVYGTGKAFVKKDLEVQLCRRWLWKWGVVTGLELIALPIIFSKVYAFWLMLPGAVFLFLGIKGARRFRADLEKVHNESFTVRDDTLVEKLTESDGDGGTDYLLVYSNGTDTWKKRVSYRQYLSAQPGQTERVVYLDGETHPILTVNGG